MGSKFEMMVILGLALALTDVLVRAQGCGVKSSSNKKTIAQAIKISNKNIQINRHLLARSDEDCSTLSMADFSTFNEREFKGLMMYSYSTEEEKGIPANFVSWINPRLTSQAKIDQVSKGSTAKLEKEDRIITAQQSGTETFITLELEGFYKDSKEAASQQFTDTKIRVQDNQYQTRLNNGEYILAHASTFKDGAVVLYAVEKYAMTNQNAGQFFFVIDWAKVNELPGPDMMRLWFEESDESEQEKEAEQEQEDEQLAAKFDMSDVSVIEARQPKLLPPAFIKVKACFPKKSIARDQLKEFAVNQDTTKSGARSTSDDETFFEFTLPYSGKSVNRGFMYISSDYDTQRNKIEVGVKQVDAENFEWYMNMPTFSVTEKPMTVVKDTRNSRKHVFTHGSAKLVAWISHVSEQKIQDTHQGVKNSKAQQANEMTNTQTTFSF